MEIIINNEKKRTLQPGTSFGELALLFNAPRSASVRCVGNCGFWAIDRKSFRKAIEDMVEKTASTNRKFLDKVNFFNFLTTEQKDAISERIIALKY